MSLHLRAPKRDLSPLAERGYSQADFEQMATTNAVSDSLSTRHDSWYRETRLSA